MLTLNHSYNFIAINIYVIIIRIKINNKGKYFMVKKNPLVSPILKWVGGKRQLLDVIKPLIPAYTTYYEPFLGGGALLFELQAKKAIINDSNEELINVYNTIKNNPEELIKKLKEHKENNNEDYFYMVRGLD